MSDIIRLYEKETFFLTVLRELEASYGIRPYLTHQALRMYAFKDNVYYDVQLSDINENSLYIDVRAHPNIHLTLGSADFRSYLEEIRSKAPMASVTISPPASDTKSSFGVSAQFAFGNRITPKPKRKERSEFQWLMERMKETCQGILSVGQSYAAKDTLRPRIRSLWEASKSETNSQKKGKALENLFQVLVDSSVEFKIVERNVRTKTEEIDFVLENRSPRLTMLQSPLILIECKNWSRPVGTDELQNFVKKVENRPRVLCRAGILITMSRFSRDAQRERLRLSGKDYVIMLAERASIEEMVQSGEGFEDFLWSRLTEAGNI